MFPLSKYVINLRPSLVTCRSKKGQTLARFIGAYGKGRFKPVCWEKFGIFSKIEPEKFLIYKYFVDECLPSLDATKALDNALHLPVSQDF